jgi:hypothetical protein
MFVNIFTYVRLRTVIIMAHVIFDCSTLYQYYFLRFPVLMSNLQYTASNSCHVDKIK